MPSSAAVSKGKWTPLFRLPDAERRLDVVVLARRSLLLLCATAVVDGRREIIGAHMQPAPAGFSVQTWLEHTAEIRRRAQVVVDEFIQFSPETLVPITAEVLRSVPIRDVMTFRERDVAKRLHIRGTLEEQGMFTSLGRGELTREDELRLAYLDDAVWYVEAVSEGSSPSSLIAEQRGVSKRTAEGRILRARALGLLTQATGRVAAGQLTEEARRLLASLGHGSGE